MALVIDTQVSGLTITATVSGCGGASLTGTASQSPIVSAGVPVPGHPNQLIFMVPQPGTWLINVMCGSESGSKPVTVPPITAP